MKLLTKTSIYYLALTFFLLLIGGIIFYFQLRNIIDDDFNEDLFMEKDMILKFMKDSAKIPQHSAISGDRIFFLEGRESMKIQLRDTILYDFMEEEYKEYRQLSFPAEAGNKYYCVIISKPLFESEDLIDGIVVSLSIISVIMLIFLLLLTRQLSKKIWTPFYNSLKILQGFDVSINEIIFFPPVKISEFRMMNKEIRKMTERIHRDYRNLKEFTENASHEIQTPLAIILSKMELMIQSENLSAEQISILKDIYESTHRLSKLNQSLLLLAKIENRQFPETQNLDLKDLIELKLNQFEELITYKNISVQKQFSDSSGIKLNAQLADILFSNLLGNAIKHNIEGGRILIELKNSSLIISNTGNAPEISPVKFFQRFKKGNISSESSGLGLSIVEQICTSYNFKVSYKFKEGNHIVTVNF